MTNAAVLGKKMSLPKPFWVLWAVELWERFGYYGTQAILALYFAEKLGFSEKQSFYVFGSFSAFVYGFIWVGGFTGDKYLGAKRTMLTGAIILALAYASLAVATQATVFYSLAAIIVGNALFKANPSSLISKLYEQGDSRLDGAMTLYYMAVNVGAFISQVMTPIIAENYGWGLAFAVSAVGLTLGIINFTLCRKIMADVATEAGREPLNITRLLIVLGGSLLAIVGIAQIITHTWICNIVIYLVVTGGLLYFLKIAFTLQGRDRARMIIAAVLILQAVVFFVLYNQMPTSLTFFAKHNIHNYIFGLHIPPAEYQGLNPFFIVIMSPILAFFYGRFPATHITKFCIGMTLCALAFLTLYLPQFISATGIVSPLWMVVSYYFQSVGELFVSALGLSMVAELCPKVLSGFVMGIWFLSSMLAGPVGAWVGALTAPQGGADLTPVQSLQIYTNVFGKIGLVTLTIAILMWMSRRYFNRLIGAPTV